VPGTCSAVNLTPPTDSLSTNPTVPIATDKHGAPLSLPRKQTGVTPVLTQFEGWMMRTGRFLRLVENGAVYVKGTVYVRGRDDLAILASGKTGPTYTFKEPCPATPGRVAQFKSFTGEQALPNVPTQRPAWSALPAQGQRRRGRGGGRHARALAL